MRRILLFILIFFTLGHTVFGQCGLNVDFNYSSGGCRIVNFTQATTTTSNYTPVKYEWSFGDGQTASGPTYSHYYATNVSGVNIPVKLVVTAQDPSGDICKDSINKLINISTIPQIYIASDPNSPTCLSDTTQFYGFSNTGISSWHWDFGDLSSSDLRNPLHQFADTGTFTITLYVTDSNGCSNSVTEPYQVVSPSIDFTLSTNPASVYDTLKFLGTSNENVVSWHWDFDDGGLANIQNPSYQYSSNGTYNVTLSVLTENLCSTTVTHQVSIETIPYSNFDFSGQCLGEPTTFTDESYSPSGIKKWVFKFGDGDSTVVLISDIHVTHPVVYHTYAGPGTYAASLTVYNAHGNSRTRTKNIAITAPPQVDFSYSKICSYDTTVFQDKTTSDTTLNSWKWIFSDGYYSSAQDTLHRFINPGTYPVKLVVQNIYGCGDSVTKNVTIDSLPNVSITMLKSKLCFGEPEQFSCTSQDTVSWHWDFGNGDTSAYQNPLPYTYDSSGTYIVKLRVTDSKSCVNSTSDTVVVMDNPTVDFSYSSQRCKTDSVSFVDKTTTPSGILTSFNWNFGDTTSTANQSTAQNPSHFFSGGAGSYKVQLLATNSYGCSDSTYKYVKIFDTPKPGFTYVQSNNPMTLAAFTDTTKQGVNHAPISTYLWTFYQNDTSHLQYPTYDFPAYDSCYPVRLTVTDTNGCSNTDTAVVCLIPPPAVDFTISNDSICLGENITFSGIASNIASWQWNFGNGDTSLYQSQTYKYTASGIYTVTLSVTDVNGYSNSVTHKVYIWVNPNVDFSYGPGTCKTDTISFQDKSTTSSGGLSSFSWNFGDPSSVINLSTQQNPLHFFSGGAGSYKVKLIATNTFGCSDSSYKYVKVYDTPKPGFTYVQSNNPMTVAAFTDTSKQGVNRAPISSYLWTFYQNDTSHLQNPTYDFPAYDSCYPVRLTVTDTNGCINTDTVDVCLVPPPAVGFSMSNDSICLGENITFSGQATNIASWHWNFGNGDTSVYQNQTYKYTKSGIYTVELRVIDVNGFSNSVKHKVYVFDNPVADFTYGKSCQTDTVAFLDKTTSSSGGLTSFHWNFGDTTSTDNISTLQNPKHYFNKGSGSYKVSLLLTNTYGCSDSTYKNVKIYDSPVSGFSYHQLTSPMTRVDFTDTSAQSRDQSPIISYHWNIYNGDVSDSANPSYTFPNYGQCYPVTLTVTDTNGCDNADTVDVCLVSPPTVDFTMSNDSICLGEKITFSGQATNIASWYWNFGNGDTSVYQNQTYQYPATGTYTITLRVTDVNGYSNLMLHKVFVSGNPKADFTYGRACQTDSVYFSDKTVTPTGIITSMGWNFDDSTSTMNQSSQQNPSHFFTGGAGSYHVRLYATNTFGCSDTIYKYVKVHDNPKAGFVFDQQCTPRTLVNFADTSQESRDRSPINGYLWHFYNGDVSDSANPSYNFPADNQCYPVTLTVTDTNGCSNTDTVDVCLLPPPAVDFTMSNDSICLGEQITFSGQATNIAKWHWDFGNGDTSIYQNQTYQYPVPGTYTVKLTITSLKGCTNSIIHKVFVSGNPTADFTYGSACQSDSVHFSDRTVNSSGMIISLGWEFGDAASGANQSNLQNPAHYFSNGAGSYHVKLYAVNTFGCSDTVYKYVKVHDNPKAGFTYTQQVNPMTTVSFTDTSQLSRERSPIEKHLWSFYNGDVSDSANPSFNFPSYGQSYPVSLMVTDTNGCSNTDTIDVDLLPPPPVDFSMSADSICLGEKITFVGQASNITKWHWDFGNGDTSIYQSQVYQYKEVGTYTITLSVTDVNGFSNSVKRKVFVSANPKADFIYGKACQADSVYFSDRTINASGLITSMNWNFDDPSSVSNQSTQQNPSHYFTSGAGSYHVKLYVTNAYGCSDTTYKYVKVHDSPKAGFTFTQQANPMTTVSFADTSEESRDRSPINSYLWHFYNGDVSSSQNPDYNFPSYGQCYPVSLTVTDTNGCDNTDTVDVCLLSPPPVDFTMSDDSICLGEKITFTGQASNIASWRWNFGNGDTSIYQSVAYKYPASGNYTVTLTVVDLNGFRNSIKHKVFVPANPKADFTFGRACLTDSVEFYDRSTTTSGLMTSYTWDFGDRTSTSNRSTVQNPNHFFNGGAGSYHVKLFTTNTFGCSDTVYKYVKVHDNPKAGFTYTQLSNPMTKVDFTNTSAESNERSPITVYLWTFYNGDVSDSANPSYNFPNYGETYSVKLTVTDANQCSNTITNDVTLLPPSLVDFTMNRVCMGNTTDFEASFTPPSDTMTGYYYMWDFGDGSVPIFTFNDTISHHFDDPGVYNVTLTVLGNGGFGTTVSHSAEVDSLPKADFTAVTPSCDQATNFEAPTWGGGRPIKSWDWNFGDTVSGSENTSTFWHPSHQYMPADSTYYVSLKLTNANGCSDSVTKPVFRSSCTKAYYIVAKTLCSHNPVYFKDRTSMNSSLGKINQWDWAFGDGTIKTYNTPQDSILHIYGSAGSYQVKMTIHATINNLPGSSSYDSIVSVNQSPVANFGYGPSCKNQAVYFIDSTWTYNSSLSQWEWSFNDPSSVNKHSTAQNSEHSFSAAGSYPVQLVVTDNNNCRDTVTKNVEVHDPPIASFKIKTNYDDVLGQLQFENTSVGAESYFWEFGDGHSSTGESPVYSYNSGGKFSVLLIATNEYQCSDTATRGYDLTSGLYVPNSFVPGSDNPKLSKFTPVGTHLKFYKIQIYSPWGDLLWESTQLNADGDPADGWDGTYKGQPMPSGHYIWRIKAEFQDNTIWKGSDNGDGNKKNYGTLFLIR
ncbi:MAG: PKD domain-containing protein [Bacteroidales bacterium]|nr:PKD domain-containing protein [Bacteroidales bacterium]